MSSSTLSVDSTIVSESPVLENPSNLIQWAVLLALALQIPNLLEEIHLIIDLHYHSFPLLVVLGTFPSLLKRKSYARNSNCSDTFFPESKSGFSFKSSGLVQSKSSTKLDLQSEVVRPVASSDSAGGDEWGHFADLDGSTLVIEQDVKLSAPPSSRIILTTLEEEEEEEEE